MIAYKVFTHDLCSPIQGGDPIWDGSLPYALPRVQVDTGSRECAAGWNACREPETALRIAGLWPNGWGARLFTVESTGTVIERKDKLRAESWAVIAERSVDDSIRTLSQKWFGDLADEMADQQIAWHRALCRPRRDETAVIAGLNTAMQKRELDWTLRRYDNASAVWGAWGARGAREAWDASAARAARGAWAALAVHYAARRGWIDYDPDLLTAGIRDAYAHGLALAMPTEQKELGWAMVEDDQ